MFYQDPAAVIDRNWAFAFYEPRALWLVGSEYEIEWAGGYRLQITNIRINEDFADDLESTNHIVSFALISPEGEIVDCWQQNISQIHVEVVPLDLGPAALFIHVSKVCPDANCAYVWVQSYPIHKHVSNPALNILSIAEDSYGISAGWSDDNPGNEWIDVNGNGVREPFPGPDMVEGWGGNLYRTEEGTDYIETYDTEVGDFWYYTLTADFLLLGSDAYGIDTYWAPCGLYSPEAWRRWWRWEGIPIELPPMYWVRAHHWVWAEGKKLIKEEYVSIYTGAILIDYVKTTEWMAWQLNETKVYDGRRYFFGNLPYIAEAAEKEGLVTEPMALEKLKWQATIYEVVETTIDTKEPLYKLEEWVPLRYVFYPWEWNSWTLAGQVDGQNYYTAIYNNSEYVKPEGSDRAQCISIDPQTGLPFASWMTVPETFIGPVYSHRVLLVDLKLLKEIIGTDVTGTFAGIFDQFVGGPGVEYTGTLLISFENYTDITPPSEKDIIFEGEDVFSFFHAPFVYIAGTEAAEKAKTSCALILVGGPIVNSYVKELNDTGKLWITFIGTDKVQDWTGKVWTLEDVAATLGWPVEYVPKVTSGIGTVQYAKENPWNPDPTVPVLVVAGCDRFGTYAAAVALADPTKILRETASAWWEAGRNTQPPAVIVLGIVPGIPIPVPVAPPPGVVFVGIGPAPKETPLGG
ncbi:MAG: hypothetical protein DRN96_02655 [Thermoproteota archaeon]|nr:MAG: hypothetical protein DRN96_02655 [Candidatus Korarchaeota archaeon]